MNRRRILITGGAGFIGYHLAHQLKDDSFNQVTLVDNLARGQIDPDLETLLTHSNLEFISGDLTDKAVFDRLGSDYDEVYHLAALRGVRKVLEKPHEVLRVNVVSTLFLLQWFTAGGGKKLLFASTSESYAWTQQFYPLPMPTPEDVPLSLTDLKNPRSAYAGSKILGELAVTQYCSVFNKPFVIVRYHNVYGPRMGSEHVIPQLYERLLAGQNPLVVYSADHRRAFCYVTDAIKATVSAMRTEAACGQTLNIGNEEEEISIGELAELILKKTNSPFKIAPQRAANDPILRRLPDTSLARKILGFRSEVSLDEGLGLTLEWYANKIKSSVGKAS